MRRSDLAERLAQLRPGAELEVELSVFIAIFCAQALISPEELKDAQAFAADNDSVLNYDLFELYNPVFARNRS